MDSEQNDIGFRTVVFCFAFVSVYKCSIYLSNHFAKDMLQIEDFVWIVFYVYYFSLFPVDFLSVLKNRVKTVKLTTNPFFFSNRFYYCNSKNNGPRNLKFEFSIHSYKC